MFKIQNTKTGKFIKNMIDGKAMTFETKEHAERVAASHHRDSVLNATAWNSKRGLSFVVVAA